MSLCSRGCPISVFPVPESGNFNPMVVNGVGGDNRMDVWDVCIIFRIKLMGHKALAGSRSTVFVCKNRGQYTPVVLMVGRYEGDMEPKVLQKLFYKVEHREGELCEYDKPLADGG